ncbi:MAG: dihydropteroate synthase [Herpetosiphonaceae bacterium]|nr:MAG: dihydropteroate synthase [Herpetosiphonaceae bacterium]
MNSRYNVRLLEASALPDLEVEIARIETYSSAVPRMLAKAAWLVLRADNIPAHSAMVLKQLLLANGGDAQISPDVYLGRPEAETTPALLFCTQRGYSAVLSAMRALPLDDIRQLAGEIEQALHGALPRDRGSLQAGSLRMVWGERTYVMGIINVTPDSFSRDGLLARGDELRALVAEQARRFAAEGADMLDIGGESTRPGAEPVRVEEELRRVIPAIEAARQAVDLPISIDTYKADVAARALDAGAAIVNDIWGLRTPDGNWNESLARLVAERDVPVILMHNRWARATVGALGGHYSDAHYDDLLGEICAELRASVAYAEAQGIAPERIIVDPGIGFGKTPRQNIELLRRMSELRSLGLPILLGASRKSFIGLALGLPPEERASGTAATTALGIAAGADIIRVHDVALNVQVARMVDAIVRPGAWERIAG